MLVKFLPAEVVEADERTVKEIRFEKAEPPGEEDAAGTTEKAADKEGAPEPRHIA